MAPDLTRIAALPGQGGGIASHPRLEEIRKLDRVPGLADLRAELARVKVAARLGVATPALVDRRAVLARAKALAALDRIETLLPECPTLHAVADAALGWRVTPVARVVQLLHTPRPAGLLAYRDPVPELPSFFKR